MQGLCSGDLLPFGRGSLIIVFYRWEEIGTV
jgi:hypothetical protein